MKYSITFLNVSGFILIVIFREFLPTTAAGNSSSLCERHKSDSLHRLPKLAHPNKYSIRLRPDFQKLTFFGFVKIYLTINIDTDIIELNSVDLVIENALYKSSDLKVDSKSVCYCPEKESAILKFPTKIKKGNGYLTIYFKSKFNDKLEGFYLSKYKLPSGQETAAAVADLQPSNARNVFPCWDEPSIKARFEITLLVPRDYVALSNMNEKSRKNYSSDLEEVRFAVSPMMSTYLVCVIVGQFDYVSKMTETGTIIRVFTPIGRKEEGLYALELSSQLLSFYVNYFNISYVLPKLDLISISDFKAGGMENWGLITFGENYLLANNNTSEKSKQKIAIVIAHELAHQWFGNLVTLEWWTELWLNEGFATFMAYQAIDILYPQWKVWEQFLALDFQSVLELDSLDNSHPIEVMISHPKEISAIFDEISYSKSSSIIRMLNWWIGDEAFRKGLQLYLTQYSYKSATTVELWKCLELVSNLKVAQTMETWTKQKGFPIISVNERQENDNRILTLTQEKFSNTVYKENTSHGQENTSHTYLWQIPVKTTTMFNPFTTAAEVLMTEKTTELIVEGVWKGEWIKLNPNIYGFYRVNYTSEMLNSFTPSIEQKSMPPLDRLNILSDTFALIRTGTVSAVNWMKFVKYYTNEDNLSVWNSIISSLLQIDSLLSHTDLREKYWLFARDILSPIYKKIGWDVKENEDLMVSLLRPKILTMLGYFKEQVVIEEARRRFNEAINASIPIHTSILVSVYQIVGANSDDTTFDLLFNLYKKAQTAEKKRIICVGLCATENRDQIIKVLNFSLSSDVRVHDSARFIVRVAHSSIGRELAWMFFKNNSIELRRRYNGLTMSGLIEGVTAFASEEKAVEVENYFMENQFIGNERNIKQSIETILINSKWLKRNIEALTEYLFNEVVW